MHCSSAFIQRHRASKCCHSTHRLRSCCLICYAKALKTCASSHSIAVVSAWKKMLADAIPPLHLTPATGKRSVATDWFQRFEGAGLDGVMVKPLEGII